jgi:hypothetical protein
MFVHTYNALLCDIPWTVYVYTGVHKLSCCYVTRCVTATAKFHHWTLFPEMCLLCTFAHSVVLKFCCNIILSFTSCIPHGLLPWGFPTILIFQFRLSYEPTLQFFCVMCHVWNMVSVDEFTFITEVLITKYKSQTQKYKLWIKWVCVTQLSLHQLNFVVSFPRCCYCMGLTSLHVYKTTVSCFPHFLNWRVSYQFPEQGSCYGMCQQLQAVYVSSYCAWGNHNRNPLCGYILFFLL